MARALMRVGVSAVRAYELARRVEPDLSEREADTVALDRLQDLAVDVSARGRARRPQGVSAAIATWKSSTFRSSCSSEGPRAPASRPSRPRSPTALASRGSRRPTSSARPCARSSAPSSCRRVHYSSFEAGQALQSAEAAEVDPLFHGILTRRETSSWAYRRGSSARSPKAGRPCSIPPALGDGGADLECARRPVCAGDQERRCPCKPFLDSRLSFEGARASTSTLTTCRTSVTCRIIRVAGNGCPTGDRGTCRARGRLPRRRRESRNGLHGRLRS